MNKLLMNLRRPLVSQLMARSTPLTFTTFAQKSMLMNAKKAMLTQTPKAFYTTDEDRPM